MPGLSPEAVLIFAAIKARCIEMKPRARAEYLRDVAAILDAWESAPVELHHRLDKQAAEDAAALFRMLLPRLLA